MEILHQVKAHWIQIAICWFAVQKFLTSVQDAIDAMPRNLPPIAKIVYFMQAIGNYLFLGNRVQSIGGPNVQKSSSSSSSVDPSTVAK